MPEQIEKFYISNSPFKFRELTGDVSKTVIAFPIVGVLAYGNSIARVQIEFTRSNGETDHQFLTILSKDIADEHGVSLRFNSFYQLEQLFPPRREDQ